MKLLKNIKNWVFGRIESRGYCISWGEPATLGGIISAFNQPGRDFFFVQIGAYDGKESDPIQQFVRQRGWKGLLVEPQPDAFERLKQNYADCPGLLFENTAIAEHQGRLPFYRLKPEYAPLFHSDPGMLSSLDPSHILKHLSKSVEADEALLVTDIACIPFSSLLAKHRIQRIDFLQIDAEGYDYEILKQIDFESLKPRIIRFEHAHIQASDKIECIELLISKNYKLVVGGYDITAFQSQCIYD